MNQNKFEETYYAPKYKTQVSLIHKATYRMYICNDTILRDHIRWVSVSKISNLYKGVYNTDEHITSCLSNRRGCTGVLLKMKHNIN